MKIKQLFCNHEYARVSMLLLDGTNSDNSYRNHVLIKKCIKCGKYDAKVIQLPNGDSE